MKTLLFVLAVTSAAPVFASDTDRGRELSWRWCVTCHVIDAQTTGGDVGPSFPSVVNELGRSDDELRGWLSEPHPPMPDLGLSSIEIDDIVAHISSLRN